MLVLMSASLVNERPKLKTNLETGGFFDELSCLPANKSFFVSAIVYGLRSSDPSEHRNEELLIKASYRDARFETRPHVLGICT